MHLRSAVCGCVPQPVNGVLVIVGEQVPHRRRDLGRAAQSDPTETGVDIEEGAEAHRECVMHPAVAFVAAAGHGLPPEQGYTGPDHVHYRKARGLEVVDRFEYPLPVAEGLSER